MKSFRKPLAFAVLLAVFGVAAILVATGAVELTARDWLASGVAWVEVNPTLSWGVFVLAYAAATVLLIPATFPTLAAGFVFGFPLGIVPASAGSLLGACGAFLIGRFLARDWVKRRIERLPSFDALDSAVRAEGFKVVFLSRLSPFFPFFLLNYAFGLTGVRARDYVLATWIGLLPVLAMYVWFGSLAQDLLTLTEGEFDRGPYGPALAIAGLAATVLLVVVIGRMATRALGARLGRGTAAGADSVSPDGDGGPNG